MGCEVDQNGQLYGGLVYFVCLAEASGKVGSRTSRGFEAFLPMFFVFSFSRVQTSRQMKPLRAKSEAPYDQDLPELRKTSVI